MENHRDYEKAVKQEGVTKEMMVPKTPEAKNSETADPAANDIKKDWQTRYDELVKEMEAKGK
jgi:hypothetical protein